VFGFGREHRSNVGTWVLERLSAGQNVKVVNGQYSSPTLSTHLAKMLLEVTERRITGTIHLAGADRINRYEFAVKLARKFEFNTDLIVPVAPELFNWFARRPADSSLNIEKASHLLEAKPMTVDDELRDFRKELKQRSIV